MPIQNEFAKMKLSTIFRIIQAKNNLPFGDICTENK